MPIYEYDCRTCLKRSQVIVAEKDRQETIKCKHCAGEAVTTWSVPARAVVKGGTPLGPGRRE